MLFTEVLPHEQAPRLSRAEDAVLILQQLVDEIKSPNLNVTEELRTLMREAGFVNLYFFLTAIAGHSGPYNALNETLHVEMCNIRQSDACMGAAARFLCLVGRGHYKSTVFTHGADSWEIIRNPDIKIGLANAVADKAHQFFTCALTTFKSNEVLAWLYPEYVVPKSAGKLIVPCRSRHFSEPNLKIVPATGSTAGDHFDLFNPDDVIGDRDLDGMLMSATEMYNKKVWFRNSKRTLLSDKNSRIIMVGTRYAMDDLYQEMVDNCKELLGFQHPDIKVHPGGKWSVYYRKSIENGKVIFPENFSQSEFSDMDTWQFQTQYQNDPFKSELSEFAGFKVKKVFLERDDKERFFIKIPATNREQGEIIPLINCDVIQAVDPAATERGISAVTSRSAVGIVAMDSKERVFLLRSNVGCVNIIKLFDWMFEQIVDFKGYVHGTVFESNAFQKVIDTLLRREREERQIWINPIPKASSTDKVARIRTCIGRLLMAGKLYAAEGQDFELNSEILKFPTSQLKDTLDMLEKAVANLRRPMSQEEEDEINEADNDFIYAERSSVTGY